MDSLLPSAEAGAASRPADLVYRHLLGRLISRDIGPGARISIDGTARELGVSQTPVREGLAQLEVEGLVTRIQNAGFRAAPLLTKERFDRLYEMRILVEPFAAGLAAERCSADQLTVIRRQSDRLRTLTAEIEPPTYPDVATADAVLHHEIARGSDNPMIKDSLARLHSHVHLFRLRYHPRISLDAVGEHDEVVAAITARSPRAAHKAMLSHLQASRERFVAAVTNA